MSAGHFGLPWPLRISRPRQRLGRLLFAVSAGFVLAASAIAGEQDGFSMTVNSPDEVQKYQAVMQAAEDALRRTPGNPDAQQQEVTAAEQYALVRARAQDPQAALQVLERGLQYVPDSPELLCDVGVEATLTKDFSLAEKALRRADTLQPHTAKTIYALARLEVEEQHLPEAEEHLKRYLALKPNDASAYFGLGRVYGMELRTAEARAAYTQSITLQPVQSESYYQLGQIALQEQQDPEAQRLFATVLERAPHHAGALTGMGQIALHSKDFARAEQLLAEAERSDPAYATPHYFRGLALAKLGRKDEAQAELQRGDSRRHVDSATPDPAAAGQPPEPAKPQGP